MCKFTLKMCKFTLKMCKFTLKMCKFTMKMCKFTMKMCKLTLKMCKLCFVISAFFVTFYVFKSLSTFGNHYWTLFDESMKHITCLTP